jgi:hypothetical protein
MIKLDHPNSQEKHLDTHLELSERAPDKDKNCAVSEGYRRNPSGRGYLFSGHSTDRVRFLAIFKVS